MEGLKAALEIARSLLKVSCVGVVSNSGTVVFSGGIDDVSGDELTALLKVLGLLPATRCLRAEDPVLKLTLPLEGKPVSCCVIEPLVNPEASLIVLSDRLVSTRSS